VLKDGSDGDGRICGTLTAMKGKYANAAEKRQAHENLSQRLTAAERDRDRLARELADEQQRREKEVATLRETIASLRAQRDEGVSPDLEEAFKVVRTLKEETETLRKEKAQAVKSNVRLVRVLTEAARAAGFRDKDAGVAWIGALDPDDYTTFDSSPRQKAAYRRAGGADYDDFASRRKGYGKDEQVNFLFLFYRALADETWHREGSSFVIDDWFAPEEVREHED